MAGTMVLPSHEPPLKGNKQVAVKVKKISGENVTGQGGKWGKTSWTKPCGKKTLHEGNSDHMPPNHVKDDSCSELP